IPSVAVSLEFDEHAKFDQAARLARRVIEQVWEHHLDTAKLFNVNIPTAALEVDSPQLVVTRMGVARYGEDFEKRIDPRNRAYYWATTLPPPTSDGQESDLTALEKGCVTLTPLHFDLTHDDALQTMREWEWKWDRDET
ncbi:MAG: hypothetical protein N2C14_01600, partial [Planctomycetales bacterium]